MPGSSFPRSVFIKISGGQNVHEKVNDSPAFKRARFWFWPIGLGFTILFGFFAGIQGAFVGFFYGLVCGGILLHESLKVKEEE
jgi:hypothetical protein